MLKRLALGAAVAFACACSNTSFNSASGSVAKDRAQVAKVNRTGTGTDGSPSNATDQQNAGTSTSGVDGKGGAVPASGGAGSSSSPGGVDAAGQKSGAPGSDSGSATDAPILTDGGQLIPCPNKPQNVLILDFKSGWWAGDGGNFFKSITDGLHTSCAPTVTIEYHHLVYGGSGGGGSGGTVSNTSLVVPGGQQQKGSSDFATAFVDSTWNSYTQIWVLSGSSADSDDLTMNDPFFLQVVAHIKQSKAPLLMGAGAGSIAHGNAVLQAIGGGTTFTTAQPQLQLMVPTDGVSIQNTIAGAKLQQHVLFTNGVKTLPDAMVIGGSPTHGDAISAKTGVSVIATDNLGQATLAATTTVEAGGRRMVLDSDLARYYSIWQSESPDALQLLKNIIVFLSNN